MAFLKECVPLRRGTWMPDSDSLGCKHLRKFLEKSYLLSFIYNLSMRQITVCIELVIWLTG